MEQDKVQSYLAQVKDLYSKDQYFAIIDLLMPHIDGLAYELALELARAFINAANIVASSSSTPHEVENIKMMGMGAQKADEYYQMANAILDKYGNIGKEHSTYLFYKGYSLFKLGLVNDAALRFERALRFIKMGSEDHLLTTINNMLALCQSLDADNQNFNLSPIDKDALEQHIKNKFGNYRILFKTERYELLHIEPNQEQKRNFHLIVTKGLAGRKLNVPQGVDDLVNSRLELAICLPENWEFSNTENYNLWPVNALCELANYVLLAQEFIGFGYTFSQDEPFHSSTKFSGAMLTALGAYDKLDQEVVLPSDNTHVHFFELVFLYPMEIAYRNHHSASELLEQFRVNGIMPSPVRNRNDVCIQASNVTKI